MNKNELWKLYYERDKEFEKAKGRRSLITIIGFCCFYLLVFYVAWKPTDLVGMSVILIFALVAGLLHFLINATIFNYLCNKGRDESEVLKQIKKRIDEAE